MQELPELRTLQADYWRALTDGRLDFVWQHLSLAMSAGDQMLVLG